ncbi:MAG TPA: hypothetical protein VI704_03565, partial [Bacteroidota bacterium]|nr:hypothetical protein [Bacteroidota bacterium]
ALLVYTLRKPFGRKAQIIVGGVSFLVFVAVAMSWTGMDETSHWQQQTLLRIHEIITRGIMRAEVPDTLLKVLDDYYHQPKGKKATLSEVFRKTYPKVTVGANIHSPQGDWDSLRVFVHSLSDAEVVVVAQHMYSKGKDQIFRNFNGRVGMVQEKFTLTAKGVRHESEN